MLVILAGVGLALALGFGLAAEEREADRVRAELAECAQDLETERALGRVGLNLLADCTDLLGGPAFACTCLDPEPIIVAR